MSLQIETALRRGFARTLDRNGLLLVAVFFVISTINAIVGLGVARWVANSGAVPSGVPFPDGTGSALFAISPAVGGLVSLLAGLATVVLVIGALRTFVSAETERLATANFTQNMVVPGLNVIVGAIAFAILVGIGFVFFVIPGFFLLVALAFWVVYIASEDQNFIDGMQSSWALTRGHRLRVFLLGVAVVLIEIIVSIVFGIGGVGGPVVGLVVAQLGSALTTVFSLATLAAAYNQLVALPTMQETTPAESETSSPA